MGDWIDEIVDHMRANGIEVMRPGEPDFGDRIWSWRNDRGWTQRELAAKLHVSIRTIRRWETGRTVPYFHRLILRRLKELR